mmetsp:Transcript_50619/g.134786  ORF Transcript_50619/g.134786 Transcript_50619/m.134786 type:complete len:209 (+) Transcript_50619:910-1536(+)
MGESTRISRLSLPGPGLLCSRGTCSESTSPTAAMSSTSLIDAEVEMSSESSRSLCRSVSAKLMAMPASSLVAYRPRFLNTRESSSSSMAPSPSLSNSSKMRRTSTSMRVLAAKYHLQKSSKLMSPDSLFRIDFITTKVESSSDSQPTSCNIACTSCREMQPSMSKSNTSNASRKLPATWVTTATPAASLISARCVSNWARPARNARCP